MNDNLKVYLLLTTFALITACVSDARVKSDYDSNVSFSEYRTYNFSSPAELEDPEFPELLRLHYSAAIEQQMFERGYAKDDSPDILIDVSVGLKNMSSAPKTVKKRTTRQPYGGQACPNSGDYNGQMPRFPSSTGSKSTLCSFKEGLISVNMIGTETNRKIWEGELAVRIDENETSIYLVQNIVNDTNLLFKDSPLVVWRE